MYVGVGMVGGSVGGILGFLVGGGGVVGIGGVVIRESGLGGIIGGVIGRVINIEWLLWDGEDI